MGSYSTLCTERLNVVKMLVLPNLIYSQCNYNKKPSKLFYGYQKNDSKIYRERKKIQNTQNNTEGEEQSWKTVTF